MTAYWARMLRHFGANDSLIAWSNCKHTKPLLLRTRCPLGFDQTQEGRTERLRQTQIHGRIQMLGLVAYESYKSGEGGVAHLALLGIARYGETVLRHLAAAHADCC